MLGMKLFGDIYKGKRVLITGHTGFKGSWLALWLHEMGAVVIGVALEPETKPNHWDILQLPAEDHRFDIRDNNAVNNVITKYKPEIVFHLAAQSLVRRSYMNPVETWDTNIMGTVNILEACRYHPCVRAIIVVTSDKCYENNEWPWGYRENDRLGGFDPYSASKAGTEIVCASYKNSYFNSNRIALLATARAGNVIGGGDWSEDRLIPDIIRSIKFKQSLEIRSPSSTRPWQHVLDCLSGYLLLGHKLLLGERKYAEAWNFGPSVESNRTVAQIIEVFKLKLNTLAWHITEKKQLHETSLLYLDSTKARNELNWSPVLNIDKTLTATIDWYSALLDDQEVISRLQLKNYIAEAVRQKKSWVLP